MYRESDGLLQKNIFHKFVVFTLAKLLYETLIIHEITGIAVVLNEVSRKVYHIIRRNDNVIT